MTKIILRQLIIMLLSLITLTIFTFSLTRFFPVDSSITGNANVDNAAHLFFHYFDYLKLIVSGDWGYSRINGSDVLKDFLLYFPATIELSFAALIISISIGLPLGVFAARHKNMWQDKLIVSTTLVGYSMPIFWWGMLLVLLFSLTLSLTPVASRIGFEYDILPVTGFMLIDTLISNKPYAVEAFFDALHHLILPAIVLGTIPLAIFTRVTRASMIEALSSDYIRTAKAKGLATSRIIWVHALRNAMIPIITIIGLQISVLITGTLITEIIFSWPGVGKWLLEAVYRRDLVTIHGGLLAIASTVIFINMLIEITTYLINPRLRLQK